MDAGRRRGRHRHVRRRRARGTSRESVRTVRPPISLPALQHYAHGPAGTAARQRASRLSKARDSRLRDDALFRAPLAVAVPPIRYGAFGLNRDLASGPLYLCRVRACERLLRWHRESGASAERRLRLTPLWPSSARPRRFHANRTSTAFSNPQLRSRIAVETALNSRPSP